MRSIKQLLLLVLFLIALLAGDMGYYATRPLTLPALPYEFSLKQGTSLKGAAHQLQQEGALPNERMFVLLARLLGKSAQIKAGNYELETAVTPLELLDILTKGQVTQSELSIIEGWTFSQFRAALNANPAIRHDSATLSEAEILQRLGIAEKQLEGLFFPDTYYFASGASDLVLLKRAYQTMQKYLQENWQTREAGLPLESPYQALILASIVEKETGQASDRGMIAGVFANRLRRGMLLQTDPTVIYGMGEKFDGNLRKSDLLADTPYNTYTRVGLPPTPIALPGLASLQAALHPAKTDALYFVARGDGSSEFSGTLAQHNRAVNKYQK
ncbi:MAG: endolytic transglycosylase MltG [Betaproteobacteria bacterium]|nr:endolytic transglycosylase MltG [Betaproteobacteria bacterium]MDE2310061.1 endolytic transglycosylase MltG [Betaproteobacteria bacterium]